MHKKVLTWDCFYCGLFCPDSKNWRCLWGNPSHPKIFELKQFSNTKTGCDLKRPKDISSFGLRFNRVKFFYKHGLIPVTEIIVEGPFLFLRYLRSVIKRRTKALSKKLFKK